MTNGAASPRIPLDAVMHSIGTLGRVPLTDLQRLQIYEWMVLTRVFDERLESLWKQGRGLGGTFNQRGHEAISVGAGFALGPDDVVAPLHRDLGCYFLRGMSPERILANQLGRVTGVTRGRDANLHGCGDLELNIIGFVSHLPQSLAATVGVAMSFAYREEPRVAMTFVGDGSSNTGLFAESLNLAALWQAPMVVLIENNQYAYSTPLDQQMATADIVGRAAAQGVNTAKVDGNDVEAVYAATHDAVEQARNGLGPTVIEALTMRMRGHAIHDGFEYVPRELIEHWQRRDPLDLFKATLLEEGTLTEAVDEQIHRWAKRRVGSAVEFAEASPWPDPESVEEGVYAP